MTHRFLVVFFSILAASCARRNFFQPDARLDTSPLAATADSARVTAGRHYHRGPLGRFILGRHHRPAWEQPVTLPVLDVRRTVPGGLQPGKIGGGFQTTSMTVLGPDGRGYALRSIDKDPYRTLPKVLRHTGVLNLVRDATSAGHPYGAFVVPPLAEAAGVPHANPRPYYVRPDEAGLGPASERYRGRVVLLEEKLEGKASLPGRLPGATALEESDKALEARYATPRDFLDEPAFLRARLLDLWLGDWDRHEGQWTWAAYPAAGRRRWVPVPQDRDQVFFRFGDGPASWLVSKLVPKFRTFKPGYESIEGYTRNARYLDAHVLSEQSRAAYLATARDLQTRLTDSVIAQAVRRGLPREVYRREGAALAAALRARRNQLPQAALDFYRLRARQVLVAGTDRAERFVVERLSDTATVVSVYRLPGDDDDRKAGPDSLLYRRSFHPAHTQRVLLHGLQGDDVFELRGTVRRSPFIDIYGGPDEDHVRDQSRVAGLRRKTRVFDTRRNNAIEPAPELKNRTTRGVESHAFDRDGSGR